MEEKPLSENETPRREFRRRNNPFIWGIVLIVVGFLFVLQNLGALKGHFNWWAVFILVPAIGILGGAWYAYRRSGSFGMVVLSSLGSGLVVLTVALMFLFDMDWGKWWPLMLIVPGFSTLLNGFSPRQSWIGEHVGDLLSINFWIGISVMGLGAVFLANNLQWINITTLFGTFRWWGIFILIPGIGGLINAGLAFMHNENRFNWRVQSMLVIGLILCAIAAVAMIGLDWNLLAPIILILVGLGFLLGFTRK